MTATNHSFIVSATEPELTANQHVDATTDKVYELRALFASIRKAAQESDEQNALIVVHLADIGARLAQEVAGELDISVVGAEPNAQA